ncbi:Uncharacterised protein [Legionella beliardensis]|uniref:Opacity protein and related surface antigens n=1 Tax=Legionella beliardensis TaxID=91822 RepID=A0A378I0L4_9GAMM|nr:hypothetical protein [Legionella beliardensis]STX28512.1 Uncharacterised protein [Legionella beliardensis]
MKSNYLRKGINYPIFASSILFALINANAQAGTMGPIQTAAPGKAYIGVFGGGGTSNRVRINQYATALFDEDSGGPLAVNAFGHANHRDVGIVGGHVGYQWMEIFLNSLNTQWSIAPAVELEGYYLGKSSFKGYVINDTSTRLPEHDFRVSYPLSTGVFLGNAVLNLNLANSMWHPYVAAGIGSAILSVSDAYSLQVAPPELGVNHYNAYPDDKVSTFAAQTKVGLSVDLSQQFSVFAEYRWLYLANTHFTFGSTVYPSHAPTTAWVANFGTQHYNMGALGIRYSV